MKPKRIEKTAEQESVESRKARRRLIDKVIKKELRAIYKEFFAWRLPWTVQLIVMDAQHEETHNACKKSLKELVEMFNAGLLQENEYKVATINYAKKLYNNLRSNKTAVKNGSKTSVFVSKMSQEDFDSIVDGLKAETRSQRNKAASALEGPLNEFISKLPFNTLDEKKVICAKLEEILEPLGLAVEVPREPFLPSKLKATSAGNIGEGRFHFELMVDGSQKKLASSATVPHLKLVDAFRDREIKNALPAGEGVDWQLTVGPKSARQGRKVD